MRNVPPAEPATGAPTPPALPETETTCRGSPSGSVSLSSTLPVIGVFSPVVAVSSPAVGPGLVTVMVKVCVAVSPVVSVAVTTTW